jgi:hypothetical protein
MACGIIEYYGSDLPLRTTHEHLKDQLAPSFSTLGLTLATTDAIHASISHPEVAQRLPGFADILGLLSEWLPIPGLPINRVDNPFPFPIRTMGETPEARVVWMWLLKQQESTLSDPKKRVLQFYEVWANIEPEQFRSLYRVLIHSHRDLEITQFFQDRFDEASKFLGQNLGGLSLMHLVKAHIEVNAHSLQEAEASFQAGHNKPRDDITVPGTNDPYQGDPIFTERAFLYAENVSKVVKYMEKIDTREASQRPSYEDAWWMMMMRLHAWMMSIRLVDREGVKISSEYYDNPVRVYIL